MAEAIGLCGLWGFAMFMLGMAVYEHGRTAGVKEVEELFKPVLELATKWAEIHMKDEKRGNV